MTDLYPSTAPPTPEEEFVAKAMYEARHSGLRNCYPWGDTDLDHDHPDCRPALYRDAKAAIAAVETFREEGKTVALWMIAHGYATGHGDTVESMLGELESQAFEHSRRGYRIYNSELRR